MGDLLRLGRKERDGWFGWLVGRKSNQNSGLDRKKEEKVQLFLPLLLLLLLDRLELCAKKVSFIITSGHHISVEAHHQKGEGSLLIKYTVTHL